MLKAGIIGLGVGEAHIAGYEAHPGCRVVALCDFDRARLAVAKESYPGKRLTDRAEEILQDPDIDVVSIASYDDHHFGQVVTALEHDKHVFVEKPLCLQEEQARRIRTILREKPQLKLSSNLILRKSPRFIELREWIRRGRLGALFHLEGDYNYGRLEKITAGWRGKIDGYSVVLGGGIHMIDLFLWLTGQRITEVSAMGNRIASRNSQFRYNDVVVSILRFEDGATGKMAVNFGCVQPHFHSLSVYGTRGTFVNGKPCALLYESRDPSVAPLSIDTEYPGVHKGNLIHGLVESILKDRKPEVDEEDIFRALSVCFAIEKASSTSCFVEVDYI